MEKMIDWESLSWVEYSSGIEVLYLAKYFRQNKKTHASIMKHALDEYRHGTHYRNLAKKYTGINKISTNINLMETGGLKNTYFPINENELVKICNYLKIGEQRAWDSNKLLIKLVKDNEIIKILNNIQSDEKNHESGLDRYLKKYPIKTKFHYSYQKIRFKIIDLLNSKIIKKLKNFTDGKLIIMIME
jgi:rubrerythrin